jgi:hypothetical protein
VARRSPKRPFYCSVISETVSIAARRRRSLDGRGPLFVQCSEVDCQYVDTNAPPCPLTLDLVAEDLPERPSPDLPRA